MEPINMQFISLDDLMYSGCFDINFVINTIEDVLLEYKEGKILLPDKISQIFDKKTQNRINNMSATLLKQNVSGVKWVSVFPSNPKLYNSPNVSGVIILSELIKGFPFAVMDGTLITALRTACMGAIAAKYLARKNSKIIGIIGAGEQAKMHFIAIKKVKPEIKICKVASRTSKSEDEFINMLKNEYDDVTFIKCNGDFEEVSADSDIIVTATSAQAPLLKAAKIKKGAFYCHTGGWEDEYDVVLQADKIVCDHWASVKHRTQTVSLLYKSGKLKDEDIYADIIDVIDGTVVGRENEEEFIYFNTVGLAYVDIAVAKKMYDRVMERKSGVELTLNSKTIFEYENIVGDQNE